jgi:type II secretory pathway pseudopilin PulG
MRPQGSRASAVCGWWNSSQRNNTAQAQHPKATARSTRAGLSQRDNRYQHLRDARAEGTNLPTPPVHVSELRPRLSTDPMNASDLPPPTAPSGSPVPARTSGLAVTSLVLGILGFLIVPAVAGLVCGIVAWIQINRSAGALKGRGVAIAGTVLSGVMLALAPIIAILVALLLPALAKAKSKAQEIHSLNNVKQLNLAIRLYSGDSGGVLPAATNWCEALRPYLGDSTSAFVNQGDRNRQGGNHSSYAYNISLAGKKIDDITPDTVTVFEVSPGGWNVSGGPDLLRQSFRPGRPIAIGFADGHAESVRSDARVETLHWEP